MVPIIASVAIAVLFASGGPAGAEILTADLRVNGMTCPFCAFGIEKKLRAVDGVQEVEILFDEGLLKLTLAPDNKATTRDLDSAVKDSGFKLSGLTIKVRGKLVEDQEGPVLDGGPGLRFHLLEERDGKSQHISKEAMGKLRNAAGDGLLTVLGTTHDHTDGIPGLLIERPEPAEGRSR
jgi:mercuric ion binding protein